MMLTDAMDEGTLTKPARYARDGFGDLNILRRFAAAPRARLCHSVPRGAGWGRAQWEAARPADSSGSVRQPVVARLPRLATGRRVHANLRRPAMADQPDFAQPLDLQQVRDMAEALAIFRTLNPEQKIAFRKMAEKLVQEAGARPMATMRLTAQRAPHNETSHFFHALQPSGACFSGRRHVGGSHSLDDLRHGSIRLAAGVRGWLPGLRIKDRLTGSQMSHLRPILADVREVHRNGELMCQRKDRLDPGASYLEDEGD